jgi:hypothetical protein
MEHDQRVIIRFSCNDRVSPEEIHAHLEAQFGDATYSERSVRRSCQYVRQGREDFHDEVQSGRPGIDFDFRDVRILALPDEHPFDSAHSIVQALGVFHATILNHLQASLGMENLHLRWASHELTTSLQQIRMETCRELLLILEAHEKDTFRRFVTGDESWSTLEFHHSTTWSVSLENVPQKVK